MNSLPNKKIIKIVLLTSLVISSVAAILASLQDVLGLTIVFNIAYLIYLPSIVLLAVAFYTQYIRRDMVGIGAIIIIILVIVWNVIYGVVV